MLVVADTSPLNYLVLLGETRLLPAMFGSVTTTPAVLRELADTRSPDAVSRWGAAPPEWLVVRSPSNLVTGLSVNLGDGELEAISLARELHADLVLIDERDGTESAESLGLAVTGTLGILGRAAARGMIDLDATFGKLRQTSFRATHALYQRVLREYRPKPQ